VTLASDLPLKLASSARTITVIGDVILDTWVYGTSHRLAREAPAPVVDRSHEEFAPGGAANTAMNLAALGARVRLVGLAGHDAAGHRLQNLLARAGVDTTHLVLNPAVSTTTKSRVVVGDQVLFRLDETPQTYPAELLAELCEHALTASWDSDALIICDYDGPIHQSNLPQRLGAMTDRPLTVVDAHDPSHWAAAQPDLITPNQQEAEIAIGTTLGTGQERVERVAEFAHDLLEQTAAAQVVVTFDRDGTVLFNDSGVIHRTWANPASEKQASGAGDTFVAALTLALASGLTDHTALDLAQSAADVVVHRLGTSLCSTRDLMAHLNDFADALTSTSELLEKVAAHRQAGRRIILSNGCFDVLHRGHISYLNKASQLGDILIVAVNDDDSVRRLKGEGRPINPLSDRAGVLAALNSVDYVTAFSTDTPIPLIEKLQPDIYVKGGDYTPEMLTETAVVRAYGGEVRIMNYVSDHSTSALVERMKQSQPRGEDRARA